MLTGIVQVAHNDALTRQVEPSKAGKHAFVRSLHRPLRLTHPTRQAPRWPFLAVVQRFRMRNSGPMAYATQIHSTTPGFPSFAPKTDPSIRRYPFIALRQWAIALDCVGNLPLLSLPNIGLHANRTPFLAIHHPINFVPWKLRSTFRV